MLDHGAIPDTGRSFSSPKHRDYLFGVTHPPIQWITEALSYGIEQPQHEIHNSPALTTKVNNADLYLDSPTTSRRGA